MWTDYVRPEEPYLCKPRDQLPWFSLFLCLIATHVQYILAYQLNVYIIVRGLCDD